MYRRCHDRLLGLRACIVVGDFDANLASVFTFTAEIMPLIVLAATGNDNVSQVDPGLADDVCLFVVVENGDFELVIIG